MRTNPPFLLPRDMIFRHHDEGVIFYDSVISAEPASHAAHAAHAQGHASRLGLPLGIQYLHLSFLPFTFVAVFLDNGHLKTVTLSYFVVCVRTGLQLSTCAKMCGNFFRLPPSK